MYGGDFAFNSSFSKTVINQDNGDVGTYNSTRLSSHLGWLYDLVNAARSRGNSAYSRAESAEKNAINYADNNFIKTSRSFSHSHGVKFDYLMKGSIIGTVTISGKSYNVVSSRTWVSDITGTKSAL